MRIPPNEQRNFVHKRLFGAAKGFVTSGFSPTAAAAGFLTGGGPKRTQRRVKVAMPARQALPPTLPFTVRPPGLRPANRRVIRELEFQAHAPVAPAVRRPPPRTLTARPDATSAAEKAAGRAAKFGASGGKVEQIIDFLRGGSQDPGECGFGRVWDEVEGRCVFGIGEQAGRDDTPIGDVVMGRYGAGEMPGNMVVNRALCRPGMVVGDDGVCYNRSQIKNSEREWPRGRRPLLTGGDMRAIATAARAGRRLERTTKRLQKIGMMKKPAPRRRQLPAHQHQITSGGS